MTRDSWLLKVLLLLSVILTAISAFTPEYLGVSDIVAHRLTAFGAVVAAVAGFLQTSPLAGANDANKVNPSGPRSLPVVLLALALGASLSIGCAGNAKPLTLPTPAAIATAAPDADRQLRAYADKSLGVLDAALDVVREVNAAEKQVETLMSPSLRTSTRAAMTAVVDQIAVAAKAIKAGAKSFAELKSWLDPVLAKVQGLVELVHTLPSSAQNRAGFGPLVSSLFGIVTNVVAGAHQ